jgi:polar amino acid transport system substrate-binding protein
MAGGMLLLASGTRLAHNRNTQPRRRMNPTLPLACCLFALSGVSAAQGLTVAWRDKPPYHYVDKGVDRGFLLERGKQAFAAAGIPATFVVEPTKRIWANFKNGKTNYCSLGRYKMSERDAFVQYSRPIHIDPPHVLLVAANALPKVRGYKTMAGVLSDPAFTIGVSDGGSYGPQIDRMIAASQSQVLRRTVESNTLIRMVAAGRMSLTIADRYGWEYQLAGDTSLESVTAYPVPDMPPGLTRYVVCSKDVPAATMARLDKALEQLKFAERPPSAAELAK